MLRAGLAGLEQFELEALQISDHFRIISESFPNHFHVRSQISTGLPRV
jgi:hypothetical protein